MFQFPAFASNPYVFRVRYLIYNAWKPVLPIPRGQSPGVFCPHAVAILADRCAADGAANNGRRPLALRHLPMSTNQKPAEQISQAFKVGFPIRRSMDQSLFAAPHGLSQRITSFIACACQGIHQMPLYHLIVLIAYAHHLCRF